MHLKLRKQIEMKLWNAPIPQILELNQLKKRKKYSFLIVKLCPLYQKRSRVRFS